MLGITPSVPVVIDVMHDSYGTAVTRPRDGEQSTDAVTQSSRRAATAAGTFSATSSAVIGPPPDASSAARACR